MGQIQVKINYFLVAQCERSNADYDRQIEDLLRKKREVTEIMNRELDRAAKEGGIPVPDKRKDVKKERRLNGERRNDEQTP